MEIYTKDGKLLLPITTFAEQVKSKQYPHKIGTSRQIIVFQAKKYGFLVKADGKNYIDVSKAKEFGYSID